MENLLSCHGRRFTAKVYTNTIGGINVKGIITIENGKVYLCQDVINGADCDNKQGYRYSYYVGRKDEWSDGRFYNFQLLDISPSEYKDWQVGDKVLQEDAKDGDSYGEVIFRSGELVVLKFRSGNASGNFTCDELFRIGFRLVEEKEDVIELTLEDVAKLKGVSVDRIRIKE